jgi:hypothetical protein
MDSNNLKKQLLRLCHESPSFRRKLAAEVQGMSRVARLARVAGIDDDYMSWQALNKLSDQAPRVLTLLRDLGEDLEDWQEHKIQLAAEYLDAVHDSLAYGRP